MLGTVQLKSTVSILVSLHYKFLLKIKNYSLKKIVKLGRCPIPAAPINGSISPVTIRIVDSTVTFQCDLGYEPTELMTATCMNDLTWNPDPESIVCGLAAEGE